MCNTNQNIDLPPDDNTQSNLKDLYKRYCDCRDQELDRFWKNSAFVWTFLAICFGAYGLLLSNCMSQKFHDTMIVYFPPLSLFICVIGYVLSRIWLWMAKGSKAWSEVFEMAIWEIEDYRNKFQYNKNFLIHNFWTLKTDNNYEDKNWKEKMFSTRPFSPSKICFVIGWFLIVFWILAFIFCICLSFIDCKVKQYYANNTCSLIIVCIVVFIFIIISIWFLIFCKKQIKSSTLRDYSENELFKTIRQDEVIDKLNTYFEVKEDQVLFFIQDKLNETIIQEHYNSKDVTPPKIKGNKIIFKQNDIDIFYKNYKTNTCDLSEISETFKNNSIKTSDIKVVDKCLFIYLEKSVYQSNANKIAEIINDFAQKNKIVYIQYKINN